LRRSKVVPQPLHSAKWRFHAKNDLAKLQKFWDSGDPSPHIGKNSQKMSFFLTSPLRKKNKKNVSFYGVCMYERPKLTFVSFFLFFVHLSLMELTEFSIMWASCLASLFPAKSAATQQLPPLVTNMFQHFRIILTCNKNLVNKHKKLGIGQTLPPLELFPFFPVFF